MLMGTQMRPWTSMEAEALRMNEACVLYNSSKMVIWWTLSKFQTQVEPRPFHGLSFHVQGMYRRIDQGGPGKAHIRKVL